MVRRRTPAYSQFTGAPERRATLGGRPSRRGAGFATRHVHRTREMEIIMANARKIAKTVWTVVKDGVVVVVHSFRDMTGAPVE